MTIAQILKESTSVLATAGIATARLDCLVLLSDALDKEKGWLLAHQEETVQGSTLYSLRKQITRRAGHEPLAYIRGKSEFYSREFLVNARTLEPRPETETMIDLLKQILEDGRWKMEDTVHIVDIGTGSGCIAITAKLEWPSMQVIGIDIDPNCVRIARKNAKTHHADVQFLKGNLLTPLSTIKYQLSTIVVVANLPYVPESHTINDAAMHEPKHAIFGGTDGLDYYRELFSQANALETASTYVLTESLPFQHSTLAGVAQAHGYSLKETDDFIQIFSSQ
ncbi:peptide chain release factor N(5)-glutamine methyltransferase [soil metagenome]